jgi:hypothetical protein
LTAYGADRVDDRIYGVEYLDIYTGRLSLSVTGAIKIYGVEEMLY